MPSVSPQRQLESFLGRFTPAVAAVARQSLLKLQKRVPGATRLVYDNYNALAIGFCPTARPSDCVLSIAVFPRWVSLFFFNGTELDDPDRLLKGKGNRVRHIVLRSADDLETPAVKALLNQATKRAEPAFPKGTGELVIQSVSAKQRPRRPGLSASASRLRR